MEADGPWELCRFCLRLYADNGRISDIWMLKKYALELGGRN
jgi:hypothetical protein